MPLLTPFSVILGVLLAVWLKPYAYLVPWIFGFMTFSGSLGSNFTDLKKVILKPWPLITCLVILHIVMPLIAWGYGTITFSGDLYTMTGLILGMVIPTGIISFMWVSIYYGNVALTLSLILIDTIISPFIVPLTLNLLIGAKVHMDTWAIMNGLIWMIVFPSLLGMCLNQLTKGRIKNQLGSKLSPFSKLGLVAVMSINSSVVAPFLHHVTGKLVLICASVLVIACLGYAIGWLVSIWFKWDREILVALTFNSGMRNISSGTVLAISYFPAPVAIPVLTATLFQQILASLYGQLLHRYYKKKQQIEPSLVPSNS
ncbi:MAG: putative Na+-dependent transporter [Bacilli bacterium]|nr:putative Na+-dependent transporter [Bacilli bacterium]